MTSEPLDRKLSSEKRLFSTKMKDDHKLTDPNNDLNQNTTLTDVLTVVQRVSPKTVETLRQHFSLRL